MMLEDKVHDFLNVLIFSVLNISKEDLNSSQKKRSF